MCVFAGSFVLHSPLGWIFAIIWVKFHQVSFANLTGWCLVMSKWAKDWLSDWLSTVQQKKALRCLGSPYGCFLKWRYPQNTPKWWFLVGKSMVVGYHLFRKPPYTKLKAMLLFSLGLALSKQLLWKGDGSVRILSCPWDPRDWYIYLHFTIKIKHSCR